MAPKPKKPAGPPATPPDFDIDLSAALPPGPPPKRGRGRPRSAAPPPPRKYKVRKDKGIPKKPKPEPPPAPIYINIEGSIDNSNIGEASVASDLKSKMTLKELKFLEIYLGGNISQVNALKAAGYEGYNERYYEKLARRIIVKHETQAGDHRIIFRAMGAGEVAVVAGLLKLAQGSKSDMVRLNAWSMIAKCIGLTKEQVEGQAGITIIFEGAGAQGQPAALALPTQDQAPALPSALPYAGRVLQITK